MVTNPKAQQLSCYCEVYIMQRQSILRQLLQRGRIEIVMSQLINKSPWRCRRIFTLKRGRQSMAPLLFMITVLTLSWSTVTWGAPDDRGAMGGVYAIGLGGFISTGEDDQGARLSSEYGMSVHLMLGEEVLPKLFVGIGIDAHIDPVSGVVEPSLSQLYAFGMEGRYRLSGETRGLLLIGGLGIGAGGYASAGESLLSSDTSSGGSIWKLGVGYELGGESPDGFTYTPRLLFQRLGPQMESQVSVNMLSLSVELLYASGRESRGGKD